MQKKNPDYDQALAELQQILADMQGGNIGLEALQARTKRAMELIRLCREKLRLIGEALDQLEDPGSAAGPED